MQARVTSSATRRPCSHDMAGVHNIGMDSHGCDLVPHQLRCTKPLARHNGVPVKPRCSRPSNHAVHFFPTKPAPKPHELLLSSGDSNHAVHIDHHSCILRLTTQR